MRRSIFAVPAVILVIAGCAAPRSGQGHEFRDRRDRSKTICEIMAKPDLYAGRRLLVRGTYSLTPHQRVLADRNCRQWEVALLLRKSEKGREPANHDRVIYSGIFTSSRNLTPCEGPECFRYSLRDSRLVGRY